MYSVDIDVGGTLTDGIFNDGTRHACVKVDTTSHDLTVCLFDCLSQGASQLGFADLPSFLEQVELLRWSTTLTSNVLAESRGPKIGLIVSKGHEGDLYGEQALSPLLRKVVDPANVIGVEHSHGPEILGVVRSLLERGVRRICISLSGGLQDPEQEKQIQRIIEEQYPDHFLGSVPVLVGSDISQAADEATRTAYAAINAYTHSALAATLFKAEDELRYAQGYTRPFLICHINGGAAGVSKTRAIDTIESGPILGIFAAAHLARARGLNRVVALDVGGTTAKIGVVENGEPIYSQSSDLFGIPLRVRLPYLRSIALGGGSVVTIRDGAIQLGPESMGSFPGPICYGLGGDEPTLTDSFVAAGLIDPEYFLGGNKHLDISAAMAAIRTRVAEAQGTSVGHACQSIIQNAYEFVAGMIRNAAGELGHDLSDHTLFAYGGNGGLFACGVAERAGLRDVRLFTLGPVFSAFGSSVSDITHVYERAFPHLIRGDDDVVRLNHLIDEMRAGGVRDLLGEGFHPDGAEWNLEVESTNSARDTKQLRSAKLRFAGLADLRAGFGLGAGDEPVGIDLVRLRVTRAVSKSGAALLETTGADTAPAALGERSLTYGDRPMNAAIYKWEALRPGNKIPGCAVLESMHSTYFVPPGWQVEIDRHGNARAEHMEGKNNPSDPAQPTKSYAKQT